MGFCQKWLDKFADPTHFVFRVLVGLLFLQHGAQKLFGAFGGLGGDGAVVPLVSLMGLAGLIEFVGGLAIALGFFTRLAATITAVEMLIAYLMMHVSLGFYPIANGGELALLFLASFLGLTVLGNGKWSLEQAVLKKETF